MVSFGIPFFLSIWFERGFGLLYLILSLIQLGLTGWLYSVVVKSQGSWLLSREPTILDEVANIAE